MVTRETNEYVLRSKKEIIFSIMAIWILIGLLVLTAVTAREIGSSVAYHGPLIKERLSPNDYSSDNCPTLGSYVLWIITFPGSICVLIVNNLVYLLGLIWNFRPGC
jgi:hypothetical protein